jgi:hypothetical protein
MVDAIKETNGIFNKKFGYPELFTKVGIDGKITSLTGANKISISISSHLAVLINTSMLRNGLTQLG